jgi:aryl-alcohol dehydrogenase-like predicted oxidoreductase
VAAALGAGITFFDTAETYGGGESEVLLGRALSGRRDQAVIATKFGWGSGRDDNSVARGHPDYVRKAIDGSLERLGVDHVDLYQYHRPDGVTPVEETLGAMNELVRAGKVRFIGCSNFSAAQVDEAERASAERAIARFVTAQNRYSLLDRDVERDLVPVCERLGIGLIPYFPLESGLLTGKYLRGEPAPEGTRLSGRLDVSEEQWRRIEALEAFGRERGRSLLEVAIAGLGAQPAVASVIAGATKPEQIRANAAAGDWELSAADVEVLRALR